MNLIGSNFSGAAGTLLLANIFRAFQSLEKLNCSDCSLTSADIIMLIHHLKSANVICKSLNWLYLSNNSIDNEGVIALTECLPELFPRLKVIGIVYQAGVDVYGNPVSEELIHMCNKHLEAFEESRKIAILNEWERTCLPPQNDEMAHVFYKIWVTLLSKMIEVAKLFDLDRTDDALDTLGTVCYQESLQITESPTVRSTQIMEQEETDFVVSVSDSNSDEKVTPPLQPSSPRTTQTGLVPPELTLNVLDKELKTLTKPIQFGVSLRIIPQHRLEVIQQDNRNDTEGQKIALFQFIAKNYKSLGITWSIIADALHDIDYGDLSSVVRGKYCTDYI
ncbi:uncharacterized protein LOC135346186 [Halichondria panicea]|uniref:uncharacterized protein LOC135346186 n=1 Tax=Halichondria panicea TaxID=6063 RepID=UPI00312B320F